MYYSRIPTATFDHLSMTVGTCYQGKISASYQELLDLFGHPEPGDDDGKVTRQWAFHFEDGTVATVYDYDGDEWHVGGFDHKAVDLITETLDYIHYRGDATWAGSADSGFPRTSSGLTEDIMNNRYELGHQSFIDLSKIQIALIRIQNEGDAHSNAIATEALALVEKIQNEAKDLPRHEEDEKN